MQATWKPVILLVALCFLVVPASAEAQQKKLDAEEMKQILKTIDSRQESVGDYRATVLVEQREKGKSNLLYQIKVHRRDEDDRMVMLFEKPKSDAGKGYIIAEDNLFYYDPGIGKWERRTLRERIGGTDSRQRDFGAWRMGRDYRPSFVGTEKLGKFQTYRLKLKAKEDADVAYPVKEIWVDIESGNVLKSQDFTLSGKLVRSSYYPKWIKVTNEEKGEQVYVPKQIRHFNELEEGKQSTIVVKSVEITPVADSVFTKAWLESKSR